MIHAILLISPDLFMVRCDLFCYIVFFSSFFLPLFQSGSAAADQNDTVQDLLQRETMGIMRKSSCHLTSTADSQYFLPLPLDRNPVSSKKVSQGKF